ncbi:MAG: glycosyl transferase [Saprospiraceae bacterium]|nr:MAG: glycosyl transferase [Saprospiraceae bacterium]
MELALKIIFYLSFLGILHTYVFYPILLKWLAKGKSNNRLIYPDQNQLPFVTVVMSLYNEEKVIAQKLNSLLQQDYPSEKLAIYIGSDCSSDQTNEIVTDFADKYQQIHFNPFLERKGKPGVVNEMVRLAKMERADSAEHILLITDANVMLSPKTVYHLAKHFFNPEIVIVDAHMVHTGMQADGISVPENHYISSEVYLKNREGIVWGKMIGPFGGCYAIRSNFYSEVPPTFLVDDFYITMKAFEQGGNAINELEAVCFEAVSHEIKEEFRRKSRISAGNFQNLLTFPHLWWPPFSPLNFAFFSHKVLRWFGPFLLGFLLLCSLILGICYNLFYLVLFLLLFGFFAGLPLLDLLLKKLNLNIAPLRAVRYFVCMNIALLSGFIKFIYGIKNNVWEPPKRN